MKRVVIYAVLLVAAIGVWCYTHSDKAEITRLFREIERTASRESAEQTVEGAIRAQKLASCVRAECRVEIPELDVSYTMTREEFAAAVLSCRSSVRTLNVRFRRLGIESASGQATVRGILDLSGSDASPALPGPTAHPFESSLVKEADGKWRFARVALTADGE